MLQGQVMTAKKRKAPPIPSARARTKLASVPSPTVPGAVERVERTIETIEAMRWRKQIDAHQFRAAERVRNAHLVLHGSPGGAMDFTRTRGGGKPGAPPPLTHLEAAETLRTLRTGLYREDYPVVRLVVIEGHTIEQAADMIVGSKASRTQREAAGRSLRAALRRLADLWWGAEGDDASSDEIRIFREPGARPTAVIHTEVMGGVAHATGRKVFRSK